MYRSPINYTCSFKCTDVREFQTAYSTFLAKDMSLTKLLIDLLYIVLFNINKSNTQLHIPDVLILIDAET